MRTSLISVVALLALAGAAHAQYKGSSSSATPYVLGVRPGVTTVSILTVGDTVQRPGGGAYRLVGIPDGSGAFDNGDGTLTWVVNHELGATSGAPRSHGQTGAFVSRWTINTSDFSVVNGRDLNTAPSDAWEYVGAGTWSNAPSPLQRWGRYCSGDTAAPGAYLWVDAKGGVYGTDARIMLNGEEIGNEGRGYAHIVTGPQANQTWQLPHLGKFSWENSLAHPFSQRKTVVIGTDDTTPGQLYVYIGEKQSSGNTIERAGLVGGSLYGIKVIGLPLEQRGAPAAGRFVLFGHGNVAERTGLSLQTESVANGVTEFLRPEDGAWDPRPGKGNDFYFVTTDRYDQPGQLGRSRLYRLRFDDITDPTLGGAITMLTSTLDGPQMMDNICVDRLGRIVMQEDIGNNAAIGKVWLYDTNSDQLVQIAEFDPARFTVGAPAFLTQDEESSGVIDAVDVLGEGWYLMDAQAHFGIPGELVEGGQLLAMYIDPSIPGPTALAYSEAIGGDFSDDHLNPSDLVLREGTNGIGGTFGQGATPKVPDLDYVTLTVPAGLSLDQLILVDADVGGAFSFIGVEEGQQVTAPPEAGDPSLLLGWTHFGSGDEGTDLLPAMAAGGGAIGFDPPLTAGFYTFWLQELDVSAPRAYQFNFVVGEAACRADFTGDGTVTSTDVGEIINAWLVDQQEGTMLSDFNADGIVNSTDISDFINAYFEEQGGC